MGEGGGEGGGGMGRRVVRNLLRVIRKGSWEFMGRVLVSISSGVSKGSATMKASQMSQKVMMVRKGSSPDVSVHCVILWLKKLT